MMGPLDGLMGEGELTLSKHAWPVRRLKIGLKTQRSNVAMEVDDLMMDDEAGMGTVAGLVDSEAAGSTFSKRPKTDITFMHARDQTISGPSSSRDAPRR
jgi:hypothetical protein